MTLYDEYRKEHPVAAEPSEFRDIIEAEVRRALEWMRGRDKPLPAEAIKPGRYKMTQTTELMVDVVEGIHGLFVMSDYWNLPIEQFYHSGVTFRADDNAEYIRADLTLSKRHQRLVGLLSDIKGDLGFAEWGTPEHGEEILMVLIDKYYPKIKAALEGEISHDKR